MVSVDCGQFASRNVLFKQKSVPHGSNVFYFSFYEYKRTSDFIFSHEPIGKFEKNNLLNLDEKHSDLIKDINQNSVIKNIFLKKGENQQIEMLNEILKELNEIKFSRKIDELENKLIKEFDEKSYSDLMRLKSQRNKE